MRKKTTRANKDTAYWFNSTTKHHPHYTLNHFISATYWLTNLFVSNTFHQHQCAKNWCTTPNSRDQNNGPDNKVWARLAKANWQNNESGEAHSALLYWRWFEYQAKKEKKQHYLEWRSGWHRHIQNPFTHGQHFVPATQHSFALAVKDPEGMLAPVCCLILQMLWEVCGSTWHKFGRDKGRMLKRIPVSQHFSLVRLLAGHDL